MGRPRIEIPIAEVERMAALGMNQTQIARALGISPDTLERRKADTEAVRAALDRGRACGIDLVAGALFESAVAGNVRAQIFYLKANAGWSETRHRPHSEPPFGQPKDEAQGTVFKAREELAEGLKRLIADGKEFEPATDPENTGDGAAKPAEPPHPTNGKPRSSSRPSGLGT